ncbi:MAG: hypothetical protein GY839_01380 [candidate division Zixibacteria bacterium]|nr:hypothetical protein [candidate division Zixibacteria bacterium]
MRLGSKMVIISLLVFLSVNANAGTNNPSPKQLPPYWISINTDMGIADFKGNIAYGFYFYDIDTGEEAESWANVPLNSRINWDIGAGFGLPGARFSLSISSFSKNIPLIVKYHTFESGEVRLQSFGDDWSLVTASLNSAYYFNRLYVGGGISICREENTIVRADSGSVGLTGYSDTKTRDVFGLNFLVGYDYQIHRNLILFVESSYFLIFDGDYSQSTMRPLGGFSYYNNLDHYKVSIGTRVIIPLASR